VIISIKSILAPRLFTRKVCVISWVEKFGPFSTLNVVFLWLIYEIHLFKFIFKVDKVGMYNKPGVISRRLLTAEAWVHSEVYAVDAVTQVTVLYTFPFVTWLSLIIITTWALHTYVSSGILIYPFETTFCDSLSIWPSVYCHCGGAKKISADFTLPHKLKIKVLGFIYCVVSYVTNFITR